MFDRARIVAVAAAALHGLRPAAVFTIDRADRNSVCLPVAARLWLLPPRQAGRIALLDDGVL